MVLNPLCSFSLPLFSLLYPPGVIISLDVLGDPTVVEGDVGERILPLRVSRDENATLDRDIVIVLTTHDVTALGEYACSAVVSGTRRNFV